MPSWLIIIGIAILEAFSICFLYGYLISLLDRFGTNMSKVMSVCFICGMASIPLIFIPQKLLPIHLINPRNDLALSFSDSYFHAGFIEETGKFYLFLLAIYRLKQFRLPVHGIIFFSICGLGFAVIEDIYYLLDISFDTLYTGGNLAKSIVIGAWLRGTPGHSLFDALAGYYFGLAKYRPEQENINLLKGWILAIALHGTFNFLIDLGYLVSKWTGIEYFESVFMFIFYMYILALILSTYKVFKKSFKMSTREVEYHKLTYGEIQYMRQIRRARREDLKRFRWLIPLLSVGVILFFIISILIDWV